MTGVVVFWNFVKIVRLWNCAILCFPVYFELLQCKYRGIQVWKDSFSVVVVVGVFFILCIFFAYYTDPSFLNADLSDVASPSFAASLHHSLLHCVCLWKTKKTQKQNMFVNHIPFGLNNRQMGMIDVSQCRAIF